MYRYSRPVELGPHVLRIRPRVDGGQRLLRYNVRIAPTPAGVTETTDPCGNAMTCVWFTQAAESLEIHASLAVEVSRENPFEYLLSDPGVGAVPAVYNDDDRRLLSPYFTSGPAAPAVSALAEEVARDSEGSVLRFVMELGRAIKRRIGYVVREEGPPYAPEETLAIGAGSCRDSAVLYIAACRHMGLAARFVSGYVQGEVGGLHQTNYLHAWAEVYIPGGGWRGFDPTHAVAVADHHLTVAAGPEPGDAAPIHGHYRAEGVASRLETHINVQVYPLLSASATRTA